MVKKINGKSIDGLEGLEDLFDYYEEDLKNEAKKKNPNRSAESFELITFLDNERIRLEKLKTLLTDKVKNLENHSQTDQLVKIQLENKEDIIKQISKNISGKNDQLQIKLSKIFNSAFQ